MTASKEENFLDFVIILLPVRPRLISFLITIVVKDFHQVVLGLTLGMTSLSKTSQDTLLLGHAPLGPLDEWDTSSGQESLSKDKASSSINESDSNSRTGSSRTGATDEEMNLIKEGLAREETEHVFRLRILVILILVATAIAMSYTIYHITHQAEVDEFTSEFEAVADTIIASLNGTYEDGGCQA